jgi:hypothetical protein
VTETLPGPEGELTGDEQEPILLLAPREGVPPVVESSAALAEVVARFAAGTGPVAVDAERASGYRYSQRAYLVQLRRTGSGSALIDPIACPDLSLLSKVLQGCEWILHAASQDIPCLAEIGMVPPRVFDTELAGRLAGFERVGLGAMVENVLGYRLEKGHSAADRRTGLSTPLWTSRFSSSCATPWRPSSTVRANSPGRTRSSKRSALPLLRRRASTPGGAPAASTDCVRGVSWPAYAPCGRSATRWRAAATPPPAGSCPTQQSSPL